MIKKNVLITGTSRGLGKELIEVFDEAGHNVVGLTRSDVNLMNTSRSFELQIDWERISSTVARLKEKFALPFDILINNSGVLLPHELDSISVEEFRTSFEVNALNPFLLTRELKQTNMLAKKAHIVNVGSIGGLLNSKKFKGLGAYSASKGALAILGEVMQVEWGSDLVVNTLALGAVDTDMLSTAGFAKSDAVSAEKMAKWIMGFALNSGDLIAGQTISVKKNDPS